MLSNIITSLNTAKCALIREITNGIDSSTCKQSCSFVTLSINDKDCKGSTILHNAVYQGKTELVKLILLQPNVLLTLIDANGDTPLHLAARHKTFNMLELLIAKLASQCTYCPPFTYLQQQMFATLKCERESLFDQPNSKITDVLIDRVQNSSWSSLLAGACGQQLSRLFAAIHLRNPYNRQLPIHQAALNNSTECSKILLSKYLSPVAPRDCNDLIPLQLSALSDLSANYVANPSDQQINQTGNEPINNCTNLFLSCPLAQINGIKYLDCEDWFNISINRTQCNMILQQVARNLSGESSIEFEFGKSVFLVRHDNRHNFGNYAEQDQDKLDSRSSFILSMASFSHSNNLDGESALSELRLPVDEHASSCQQTGEPAVYHYKIGYRYPTDHLMQKWLSNKAVNDHTCCVSRAVAKQYGSKCLFFINDGPYFRSLCELISYHRIYSDGLKGTLHFPAFQNHTYIGGEHNELTSNKRRKSLNISSASYINSDFLYPDLTSLFKSSSDLKNLVSDGPINRLVQSVTNLSRQDDDMLDITEGRSKTESSLNNFTFKAAAIRIGEINTCDAATVTLNKCKHLPLIEINKLQILKMLGRGEFGSVWKATYTDERNTCILVAVKILNDVSLDGRRDFLREALIMSELRHSCLVRIFGIVNDVNLMIVEELLPKGSLLSVCKTRQLPYIMLNAWAIQIARGMEYMERKNVVHRDLAARNVLVSSHYQVKVSDFGLSRITANNQTYTQNKFGPAPIKWYAPESIEFALFTNKSDVWSYGITIWEMFSAGKLPYGEMQVASEILHYLKLNRRLEKPLRCSKNTYRLMNLTWIYDYRKRPSFAEINNFFLCNSEYTESLHRADADHVQKSDKSRLEHLF